jgi:hypothetical protein
LAHTITPNGIVSNDLKIETIAKWKAPQHAKDAMRFMGLCNYYRKLYQDFRSYVPINKFMADHCRWQEEQEKASEIPKEKINGKLIGVVGSF